MNDANQISPAAIEELKIKYFEEYGVKLDTDSANVKALEYLNFLKLIYKPISHDTL